MTDVIQDASSIILSQGIVGALFLLVAIGMAIVIRTMNQNALRQNTEHQTQMKEERRIMKEERDDHAEQMSKLFEATEKLSADQRADSKEREISWNLEREQSFIQLNKFNDSLTAINSTLVGFSNLFHRVNDDIRDLKIIVSK